MIKVLISIDPDDQKALKRSTTALRQLCEIFGIELKGGILHYPGEFEASFQEDHYKACLQINALQAFLNLNQIPSQFQDLDEN